MTEDVSLPTGSADEYLQHCRYVYAEFCVRSHGGGEFAHLVEKVLGTYGHWVACIETSTLDESTFGANDAWERKRKLLVRFHDPWEERKAQFMVTLGLDLGLEVIELESLPFRKGPAGEFVAERLRKIADGALRLGFSLVGKPEHFSAPTAANRVDSVQK